MSARPVLGDLLRRVLALAVVVVVGALAGAVVGALVVFHQLLPPAVGMGAGALSGAVPPAWHRIGRWSR